MYNYLTQTLENSIIDGLFVLAVTISNTLVACVWLSPKNRTPVTILLSIIALYDTLTIIMSSMNTISSYVAGRIFSVKGCYIVMVASVLAFTCHSLSIIMTTYLAIQRCVICVFPFSGPRHCGLKSTTICSIVSLVSILTIKCPELLFYKINGEVRMLADNSSALYCKVNYILDDHTIYKTLPRFIMFFRFFALHLIPSVIITVCMTVCLLTVNRKKMATSQSSDQVRTTTRTTFMLVLIMFIFVVGEFPTTISVFYRAFLTSEKTWLTTTLGNWICNLMITCSYLMNIWVYIGMSKQFRESLKNLVCGRRNRYEEQTASRLTNISS